MRRDWIVSPTGAVSHNGKMFAPGADFPAEDLGLSEREIVQLAEEGAIEPEGLRAEALDEARRLGLEVPEKQSTKDLVERIQQAEREDDGLDDLRKDELIEKAEALGIDVPSRATVPQIIALIRTERDG